MWFAEVVPPAGPIFVPALAALFTLAALFFAIGMVKLVDKVSRAFFGTVGGAVGWIPFGGRIVKHSLHRIEQKISHILGSAERTLDGYVAVTWHNMANLLYAKLGRKEKALECFRREVKLDPRRWFDLAPEIRAAVDQMGQD